MAKRLPADVQKIINSQSPKLLRKEFEMVVRKEFLMIKNQLIQEFLNHPVTKEIEGGPSASNTSGTLGGQGNLFSFIGFFDGTDPIKDILNIFESMEIYFTKNIDSGSLFTINFPEPKDIFAVTPMPWATGRSWAKGIESGISGLGYYLFIDSPKSRSGEAVQVDGKINVGKFKNTKYISALLTKYKKQITNLYDRTIPT
jgi:hypothetical protein